jgi:hypothetical protein
MATVLPEYKTRWLVTFGFASTHRISSEDKYISDVLYEGRLKNELSVQSKMVSFNWGDSIRIEADNSDAYYTDRKAAEELRGKTVTLSRYEPGDSPAVMSEFCGIISDYNILEDIAEFTVSIQNPDPLQGKLPKKTYETTDWTESAPLIINPSTDLGKAYSLPFGDSRKVPLRYVHANYTLGYYDYIIGPGPIETNNSNKATKCNIFGEKIFVNHAEYYVHDGSATIQYTDAAFGMTSGAANPYIKDAISYAFIRFKKEQLNFSGGLDNMYASIWGMKLGGAIAQRNFARVIQYILSDANWGLNQTVNTASFDTAAAALDAIGGLYCDGFVSDQSIAQDIIEELRQIWGIDLKRNAAGEWVMTIDTYQAAASGTFGDAASTWDNIIKVKKNGTTPTAEAIRTLVIEYGWNQWESSYIYKTSPRTVNAFGEDRTLRTRFVLNQTTADKAACYWQVLRQIGDHRLTIDVDMEGRALQPFNTINIAHTLLKISGVYQVREMARSLEQFELTLISYAAGIYTYNAGTLPNNANSDEQVDYSQTKPSPPTNLAVDLSGIEADNYGFVRAYTVLKADIPVSNAVKLQFGYRKYGETVYTWLDGELSTGSTWKVRVPSQGQYTGYDYTVKTINLFGLPSSGNPTLSNQITARDGTAPSVPTGLVPTVGTGKMVGLTWTANAPAEGVAEYKVYRNDGPYFSGFVEIGEVDSNRFNDVNVTIGITYRYAVAAVDRSENQSVACAYVSATPVDSGSGADATPPAQITNFTRTGESVYQTSQGQTLAYETFSWTNPTDHWVYTLLYYQQTGTTIWRQANQNFVAGATTGLVDDLVPGLSYNFTVVGVNRDGVPGTAATTITRVAPGDTTPPGTVTGLTGAGKLKTWQFSWTTITAGDLKDYHIQIATSSAFTSIVYDKYVAANADSFTDDARSYGTLYCRVKARDNSLNESASWSATASATTYQTQTGDVADLAVTGDKIANATITTAKIGDAQITTAKIGTAQITNALINDLSAAKITAGVLYIGDGSVTYSSYGGTYLGVRDGMSHWYAPGAPPTEVAAIGYSTIGSDTYIGKFLGATAAKYGGLYATGLTMGVFGSAANAYGTGVTGLASAANGTGVYASGGLYGVYGTSGAAYGGYFRTGGITTNSAPICIEASTSTSAPTHTANKGSLWVTSAGVMYININGGTDWRRVATYNP